jgi:hypothetical protein
MILKVSKSNGRSYLSIVRGYRDKETHKVRHKTIKSLGYLDDLKKQYPDPIAHFKEVVADMNEKDAKDNPPVTISLDKNERLLPDVQAKNLGYTALSFLYHMLDLHTFFRNHARVWNNQFDTNNIMKLLVFSRILNPASKKKTFEGKELYFENMDFSLVDIYRCLTQVNTLKDRIQIHLHQKMKEQYGRTAELVYYDVTNFYFEIDEQDNLRKKGVSKEHRPDPIVQMGLFMDTMGIPISYNLFPGNTNDCETLIPLITGMKRDFGLGRIIIVADKGMSTQRNIVFNLLHGDGYVYSQTVRGAHKELKEYVLNEDGYRLVGEDFKIKSRLYPREISVTDVYGKTKRVRIDEKQIIFYSSQYDRKAKTDREAVLFKAHDLINNPSKYNRATAYGAAKYIRNLVFDEDTGEILTARQRPVFDEEKLREDEKFDGYYAIITSEWEKSDEEVIEIYRGLWRIEESFKVMKSDLESRPVYLSREDHIQAHFLICFIALVIARLLAYCLGNKYSISHIVESLNQTNAIPLEENWYVLHHADEITNAIREMMGIDLERKYLRLGDIKKILGTIKKS